MPMKPEQLNRLLYLLGALRDEVISEEEFSELNRLLEADPAAQDYYLDYIYLCTDLCNLQAAIKREDRLPAAGACDGDRDLLESPLTLEMLQVLGDYEKTAETIILPPPQEAPKVPVGKVPVNVPPRRIPKLSIATLAIAVAALLFLILYVHLNPRISYEVATVSGTVDAEWSSDLPPAIGTRLPIGASEPIQLKKGVIEIATDKDVAVTIEAPAEFCFISPDEVRMNYGRLFASVSPAGSGFSVQTQNSKIIDLGTRFGVYTDMRGETELHVFKGNTVLIAGQKGQNKKTVEVAGGQAFRVDATNSRVTDIDLNANLFARGIDPQTGLVLTAGRRVDLADIVGGGDGFGAGNRNQGIAWDGTKTLNADRFALPVAGFPAGYVPVRDNPFIDGVFIPNCKGQEPRRLTSSPAALNLDDFIAADTNGQLTLVLLHETSDQNAAYWFAGKDTIPADTEKFPALTFPQASVTGSVRITTADGRGADAYVANDTLRAPTTTPGQASMLACRYLKDQRIRIVYLRFDISDKKNDDLTGAVLSLFMDFGNRYRDLQVYGLKDGPADFWDETTLSFHTAPGLLAAGYGNYRLDEQAFERLGTFPVVDNRLETDPITVTADQSHQWNAPNTQCKSGAMISNAGRVRDSRPIDSGLRLGDFFCGTDENPAISMHANAGITFDLYAIRRACGPVAFESFTAACGLSKPADEADSQLACPAASVYVLLDGQEVFSAIDLSPEDAPQDIEIKLTPQARYLTLIATQGTDNTIENDRCLFAKPALNLK